LLLGLGEDVAVDVDGKHGSAQSEDQDGFHILLKN
jgi:hypothetical protein